MVANSEARNIFYGYSKVVFDFYDVFELTSEEMSYSLVAAADGYLFGNQCSIDGSSVFEFSASVSVKNNDLRWMNLDANAWGWDPDTFFEIRRTNPNRVSSATGTTNPEVYATEDALEDLDGLAD